MKSGIEIISEERKRQIEIEGWTAEHDDEHRCGELSDATACYATRGYWRNYQRNPAYCMIWPFSLDWWKPMADDLLGEEYIDGRIKELSKAGALIAAEIDRLQRLK